MARCLVLGANGFLGSHLADSLVANGHEVRAFDRFPSAQDTKFASNSQIEIMPGDFLNRHDLKEALKNIDYVFHFISTTTPATAEDDPLIDIDTNLRMSVELFQECVEAKIKKVIFASTGGAIYGLNSSENVNENTLPKPISPYAICKLSIEQYLKYFDKKHGLKSVTFRISNPYGERQAPQSKQGVIPIFLQHITRGEPITVLGDGNMIRDYIYVKDVAKLISESFEPATQDTYNLGSGQGSSVNQIVDMMRTITGKDVSVNNQENPTTFVQSVVLDTTRFKNEFGLEPEVGLEEGLRSTWEFIKGEDR